MAVARTSRDDDILQTLTLRVHLATVDQIARAWWDGSQRAASERLRRLERNGLVQRQRLLVHPILPMERPELTWEPGHPTPEFGPVAYRLQKRWTEPMKLTMVAIASNKAAHEFGGFGGKFKHRSQLSHDCHVTELYVRLVTRFPSVRSRWVGEEILGRDTRSEAVPDALLKDEEGHPERFIDFGGRYDARRVQHFHEYCVERGIGYELW